MPEVDLTFTLGDLRRVLHCTDQDSLKRFLRGCLDVHWTDEDQVPLLQQLLILLEDWMAHLSFLTDAQRYEVVRRTQPQVQAFAQVLSDYFESQARDGVVHLPVFRLVIADYRWVSCEGRATFFDLEEVVEVEETPYEAVTYVTCDLTAVYLRARARRARVRKMLAQGKDAHEPGPENSG